MQINPNTDSKNIDNGSKKIGAGRKILAPIGVTYRVPKDKLLMEITCVCIQDLENNGDEGKLHRETFWCTPRSAWRIANWAVAMRYNAAFDCEDRRDVENVIVAGGAFGAEIAIKDVNSYEVRECSSFFVPLDLISGDDLDLSQAQTSMIERAETAFPKMVASRKSYGVTFVEPKAERNDQVVSSEKDDFSDIPF